MFMTSRIQHFVPYLLLLCLFTVLPCQNASAEDLYVTEDGVGIGEETPDAMLHLQTDDSSFPEILLRRTDTSPAEGGGAKILTSRSLTNDPTNKYSGKIHIAPQVHYDNGGGDEGYTWDTAALVVSAAGGDADNEIGYVGIGTASPTAPLQITRDDNGEAIRLTNLPYGIGIVPATSTVSVYGNANYSGANVSLGFSDGSGNYSTDLIVRGATGYVGIQDTTPSYELDVTGTIRATVDVIDDSDARLKKSIEPIDSSLAKVLELEGVYFEWKKAPGRPEGRWIGVTAQNVEKVFPEVVHTDADGFKAVAYNKLIAPLIEAIKEQQQVIRTQKEELKRLEARVESVTDLDRRVNAIETKLNAMADTQAVSYVVR